MDDEVSAWAKEVWERCGSLSSAAKRLGVPITSLREAATGVCVRPLVREAFERREVLEPELSEKRESRRKAPRPAGLATQAQEAAGATAVVRVRESTTTAPDGTARHLTEVLVNGVVRWKHEGESPEAGRIAVSVMLDHEVADRVRQLREELARLTGRR